MTHRTPFAALAKLAFPLLIAMFALASAPTRAQDLSEQTIRSFIETLKAAESLEPELEALSEEIAADRAGETPDVSRLFSDTVQSLESKPMYDRLEDIAQDRGFSNLKEWGTTGDRIFRAWMAIELEEENPGAQQEIASALAEIENSPQLTEAQKAQMRAMMESAMNAMESARNAPQQDINAVRPHVDMLRNYAESE